MQLTLSQLLVGSAFIGSALAKTCVNMTIPVTVSAKTIVFNVPTPQDEFDVIAFSNNFTSRTANPAMYTDGKTTTTGTFDISARYCKPATSIVGGKNRTGVVQVLSHGLGFEKSYWDVSYHNYKYSYTDAMLAKGYSTFAYDRLGTGLSAKPKPGVAQLALEAAILIKLTEMIREGSCAGIPAAKKVIHVGHSYGSVLSNTIVTTNPTISDGLILTGFSHNTSFLKETVASWLQQPARWNQPKRFGTTVTPDCKAQQPLNLPLGYNTWINVFANQFAFFHSPYFDKVLLNFAEATKQPYTTGQAFTLNGFMTTNFLAAAFKGPVQIVTGFYDKIYCDSDCTGIIEPSAAKFPASSKFGIHLQPNTGHALNLHVNSTGTYSAIASFLSANGF